MERKTGIQGATFGIMEGIIMVLGTIMGLSATGNNLVVLIGILTAGLADSFANSAGFYVSEETETYHTKKEIWKSTILCFLGTLGVVVILSIPILLFSLKNAIIISEILGLLILGILGYFVSTISKQTAGKLILKYIIIGMFVSLVCFGLGELISTLTI